MQVRQKSKRGQPWWICFVKFAQRLCQILVIICSDWAKKTYKHASDMELYIILATLENFECWNEMSLSQMKPIQCSLAMVGFSSDIINILQHIKHLFIAIAIVPSVLDGIDMVCQETKVLFCIVFCKKLMTKFLPHNDGMVNIFICP